MPSARQQLANIRARQRREKKEWRSTTSQLAGHVAGPAASAFFLDALQLGPVGGNALAGLAGVGVALAMRPSTWAGQMAETALLTCGSIELHQQLQGASMLADLAGALGIGGE